MKVVERVQYRFDTGCRMRLKIEAGCGIRDALKARCEMKIERRDRDILRFAGGIGVAKGIGELLKSISLL